MELITQTASEEFSLASQLSTFPLKHDSSTPGRQALAEGPEDSECRYGLDPDVQVPQFRWKSDRSKDPTSHGTRTLQPDPTLVTPATEHSPEGRDDCGPVDGSPPPSSLRRLDPLRLGGSYHLSVGPWFLRLLS